MDLITASHLTRNYPAPRRNPFSRRRLIHAVQDVSLRIGSGEVVGLIGESGSGKSTVGRMLLGLEAPDQGRVVLEGQPMPRRDSSAWRALRRSAQMIFQDPHSALDPRARILDQVREPLEIFDIGAPKARAEVAANTLALTGLGPDLYHRFPGALSGGQKQRVVIARALVLRPRLLVCDEPVSALDVSVGAQVIDLLADLHRSEGLSYMIISHDLSLVRSLVGRVLVMYSGRVVEEAPVQEMFRAPVHPYTRLLIASVPVADPARRRPRAPVHQAAARPADGAGCAFAPRCPQAGALCLAKVPELAPVSPNPAHRVACHAARDRGAATDRGAS